MRSLKHSMRDVDTSTWTIPSEFQVLAEAGQVASLEMFRAFNMGVGMVVLTSSANVSHITTRAAACGITAWELGKVIPGTGRVRLDGTVT